MNTLDQIQVNAERLLKEMPTHVTLLAATKTRNLAEIQAAWGGGIRCFGYNYVQEAQGMIPQVDFKAEWHLIGHLQRNKAAQAVGLFDMIETVDSLRLAQELEKRCAQQDKLLTVLIEINSGREENKDGVLPDEALALAEAIGGMTHLRLEGCMTMGPLTGEADLARPYFHTTREIFDQFKRQFPLVKWLSMGMSHSYQVAIEEGANLVRIGTLLFGPRS